MPTISSQPLTQPELKEICREINGSEFFAGYSEAELARFNASDQLVCLRENRKLIGIAALKTFGADWAELAIIIVLPKYRGQGYGRRLWQAILRTLETKNVVMISANPIVKKRLAQTTGFAPRHWHRLPAPVMRYLIFQKPWWQNLRSLSGQNKVRWSDWQIFVKRA